MSIDLFDPEDMDFSFTEDPLTPWKPAAVPLITPPPPSTEVHPLIAKQEFDFPVEGEAVFLEAKPPNCPRCTEPMEEDRILLRRGQDEIVLCSLICAVKHDRILGTKYNSSVSPLKTSKSFKKSGRN